MFLKNRWRDIKRGLSVTLQLVISALKHNYIQGGPDNMKLINSLLNSLNKENRPDPRFHKNKRLPQFFHIHV